jgi:preprotein translocase subunit SecF
MRIFTNANYDFLRWRWHAIALSLLVVGAGAVLIATRGLPLGIDFSGGSSLVVEFSEDTPLDRVRNAVASLPGEEVVQQFGDPSERRVLIRLPQEEGAEEGASLERASLRAEQALRDAGLPAFEVANRELVGPVIGADLQRRGIYATITSLLAITIYIGIRFRFTFAVGAIAATLHDVFVTLAFLVFFGYDISLNVVAAILTITGYSVNDTIVIFDRVRENMHVMRRDDLEKVVNHSVNQTLGRTLITAGTTFLSVLALFLFGGEVLEGFAFTMLVGIISGTYSTIFIAAAVAIIMSKRAEGTPSGAAATAAAAAGTGRPSSTGKRTPTRKASAR